jgi:hypothetical protein
VFVATLLPSLAALLTFARLAVPRALPAPFLSGVAFGLAELFEVLAAVRPHSFVVNEAVAYVQLHSAQLEITVSEHTPVAIRARAALRVRTTWKRLETLHDERPMTEFVRALAVTRRLSRTAAVRRTGEGPSRVVRKPAR